ncbi:hypothetical protein B4U37_04695 [Sutcliffiella horikoshii]|uniref:Uncharacterized protein n=1 Tax=Sutcliffiella horikoshii TaxID=79883 RepID=A0ABN4ZAM8_9BACI|nr:hypothetical protein [Sutcliffiella horikoshii]ART75382.1 hypothetical protein B4U37_04695 [Sutcliffiella horikoshii]
MTKKAIFLIFFVVALIAGTIITYIMMTPKAFYSEDEIIENMDYLTQEIEVLDSMQLDEKTYFVPHLSNDGKSYGSSIWVWSGWKWECVGATTASDPQIVVNEGNSYIFWNVHPKDEVREWEFYLTSERNYSVTSVGDNNQLEVYYPKIQMKHSVELEKGSYGYVKVPSKWKEVIGSFDSYPAETGIIPSSHSYMYQWQAFNDDGESIRLEHTFRRGGGGSYGGNYFYHMTQLNPENLE